MRPQPTEIYVCKRVCVRVVYEQSISIQIRYTLSMGMGP